jgi:glutaredoxin
MRFVIRSFFKTLHLVLGPPMLAWEWLARPTGVRRDPAAQAAIDSECRRLTLYQFKTCPFCIKVRQECRRLSLGIKRLDAQKEGAAREELARGGGEVKVPCLKITDPEGRSEWLYESDRIIAYLRGRFAAT